MLTKTLHHLAADQLDHPLDGTSTAEPLPLGIQYDDRETVARARVYVYERDDLVAPEDERGV